MNQNFYIGCYSQIMVASFSAMKGYDKFVDIAKETNLIKNDVTFLAVGGGIHLERIKKRVLDEQISNVSFTGEVNNVESLVSIADIGVLFSPYGEGISNSILEYMAMGKPVIANDAGGTKEIVKHEINGYLITNETLEEIVGLINHLLKMQKMGEAGRKLIHESFTIKKMGREFESVYHELVDK